MGESPRAYTAESLWPLPTRPPQNPPGALPADGWDAGQAAADTGGLLREESERRRFLEETGWRFPREHRTEL